MRDNKAIATVAGVVALGSTLALVFGVTGGFGPRLDTLPHRAAGRVLAGQTLALLKPGGSVTVLARDTATFQNPASDVLLRSFCRELAKAGVKVGSIETLQIDPLRPVAVPAGDFLHWIKKAGKGSVIVSLMGPPVLSDAEYAQLGDVRPAIVAFCPGPVRDQVDLRALFARGLLQAAVVTKRAVTASPGGHSTESAAFDAQFLEVTPANLAALTASANSAP